MSRYFSNKWLSYRIIAGLCLGIIAGLFFGEDIISIKWLGDAWIRLMQMAVLPYVVVSLISGVGSLNKGLAKSLALRGTLLLLLFWVISALIIFAMPLTFPQWQDASFYSSNITQPPQPFNPLEIYIPQNPFYAMANSIVPAVVLFCIAVGVALIGHKDKALLVDSFKVFSDVLSKVMSFMVQLTPIGVFAIAAVAAGTMTLEQLSHLEVYFAIYIAASILLTFVILPLLISTFTPFKYSDIIYCSRSALLTGFIAQNIFIILPMLIENSREIFEKYQLSSEKSEHVIDVIIPVTFNFPNTGRLLAILFIPFAAWMSGSQLDLSQYPELIVTGIFSFFAKAQVALPFLLDLFHIPQDMFNFYIPSAIINGKFDTMVSVMNLFAFSLIITSGLGGHLHFNSKKILRNLFIMGLALFLTVILTRTFLQFSVKNTYNKDNLVMNMQLPDTLPDVPYQVFKKLPETTATLPAPESKLLQTIKERGVLRVGYRPDRLPFSYINDQGKLVGMDIELFFYLAKDLGVRLEFYPFDWNNFADALASGQLDIIPGVNYDTFNLLKAELSSPYIEGKLSAVVKDYRRNEFSSRDSLLKHKVLKLAVLGEPVFVQAISQRLQRALPNIELKIIPLSHYNEFFKMPDDKVDALIETIEIASALTLLHPQYSALLPKLSTFKFPMSFAVASNQQDFAIFLSQWIKAKQAGGLIDYSSHYWVSGAGAIKKEPRWSIKRNVLGW